MICEQCFHFEKGKCSHYPFVSFTEGEDIVQFYKGGSIVQYFSKTEGGMSGGSIEFDNKIVGNFSHSIFFLMQGPRIFFVEACIMLVTIKKVIPTVYCLHNL